MWKKLHLDKKTIQQFNIQQLNNQHFNNNLYFCTKILNHAFKLHYLERRPRAVFHREPLSPLVRLVVGLGLLFWIFHHEGILSSRES